MKNSFIALLLLAAVVPASAQKIIEKHMDLAANGFVSMNFQISDSIHITTWKKNEVYVRSSINVNDNQNNDDYKMDFLQSGGNIDIRAKLEMKGNGCRTWRRRAGKRDSTDKRDSAGNRDSAGDRASAGKRKYDDDDDDDNCCCCCGCDNEIVHEVFLPENTDFAVEAINGNIVITGMPGAVRAHSISGFVDLAVAPDRVGSLEMKTISGTMYSNYDLPSDAHKPRRVGGGSVSAELNEGKGKRIDLQTISGDIFLRKQG